MEVITPNCWIHPEKHILVFPYPFGETGDSFVLDLRKNRFYRLVSKTDEIDRLVRFGEWSGEARLEPVGIDELSKVLWLIKELERIEKKIQAEGDDIPLSHEISSSLASLFARGLKIS
ncbi:MAG: hypothetical protein QW356_02075 [Candidatus Hadarchaeales archaeon]